MPRDGHISYPTHIYSNTTQHDPIKTKFRNTTKMLLQWKFCFAHLLGAAVFDFLCVVVILS